VLALAFTGHMTLWGAVLVDVGTALLVILNGMTVLRWSRFPGDGKMPTSECVAEKFAREHGCVCFGVGGWGWR
jgi:hypothetical protein